LLSREQQFEPVDDRDSRKSTKYDLANLLQATGHSFENGGDIGEFVHRAREWAQFGLLTTSDRRKSYLELATLMRQGTPAEDAVKEAFGVTLSELSTEFDNRRWRKEVNYRLRAPEQLPVMSVPTRVDQAELKTLFEVLSGRATVSRAQ
jgi:hypothetical protein